MLHNAHSLPKEVSIVVAADREGDLTFSTAPLPGALNIAHTGNTSKAHLPADSGQLYIATPLISRITGIPSIYLSRRVNDSQGNFAGVVALGLDMGYLANVFHSLELGPENHLCSCAVIALFWRVCLTRSGSAPRRHTSRNTFP